MRRSSQALAISRAPKISSVPRAMADLAPTQGKSAAAICARRRSADSPPLGSVTGKRLLRVSDMGWANAASISRVPEKPIKDRGLANSLDKVDKDQGGNLGLPDLSHAHSG